jgi:hypothetical protein
MKLRLCVTRANIPRAFRSRGYRPAEFNHKRAAGCPTPLRSRSSSDEVEPLIRRRPLMSVVSNPEFEVAPKNFAYQIVIGTANADLPRLSTNSARRTRCNQDWKSSSSQINLLARRCHSVKARPFSRNVATHQDNPKERCLQNPSCSCMLSRQSP